MRSLIKIWAGVALSLVSCATLTSVSAKADEVEYGNVKGWRVFSSVGDFGLEYCAIARDNGNVELRIATNGEGWQLAMPYYDSGNGLEGAWGFDGFEDTAPFYTDGDGWAYMDVSTSMLGSLHSQSNLSLELDRGPQHFSLSGSSAAMNKAIECVQRGGIAGTASSAPPSQKPQVTNTANVAQGARTCPRMGSVASYEGGAPVTVEFDYQIASGRATLIYWLDTAGNPVDMATFDPSNPYVQLDSYVGHTFIVKDFDGNCYGDFYEAGVANNYFSVR